MKNQSGPRLLPRVLFLHQGAELYGSDLVLLEVVYAVRDLCEPLVVLASDGALGDKLRSSGIRVFIVDLGVLRRRHLSPGGLIRLFLRNVAAVATISRMVRKLDISLIYSNTMAVTAGAFTALIARKRHIWHIHEIVVNPAIARLLSSLVRGASTRVIAVSQAVMLGLSRQGPTERIVVIYNGFAPRSASPESAHAIRANLKIEDQEFVVGTVSRVQKRKGHLFLIEALKTLKDQGCPFRCIFVGAPFAGNEEMLTQLEEKVKEHGIEDRIHFVGFQANVGDYLRAMDVVVAPSIEAEPFPTVILEAMALGRPVVGTSVGGQPEMIVDGVTGYLVDPRDTNMLSDRLISLFRDPLRRSQMGRAGQQRIHQAFSHDTFKQNIRRIVGSEIEASSERRVL